MNLSKTEVRSDSINSLVNTVPCDSTARISSSQNTTVSAIPLINQLVSSAANVSTVYNLLGKRPVTSTSSGLLQAKRPKATPGTSVDDALMTTPIEHLNLNQISSTFQLLNPLDQFDQESLLSSRQIVDQFIKQ